MIARQARRPLTHELLSDVPSLRPTPRERRDDPQGIHT